MLELWFCFIRLACGEWVFHPYKYCAYKYPWVSRVLSMDRASMLLKGLYALAGCSKIDGVMDIYRLFLNHLNGWLCQSCWAMRGNLVFSLSPMSYFLVSGIRLVHSCSVAFGPGKLLCSHCILHCCVLVGLALLFAACFFSPLIS